MLPLLHVEEDLEHLLDLLHVPIVFGVVIRTVQTSLILVVSGYSGLNRAEPHFYHLLPRENHQEWTDHAKSDQSERTGQNHYGLLHGGQRYLDAIDVWNGIVFV